MNSRAATPCPTPHDGSRDYLFDMIEQLSVLARRTGEIEVSILLRAVLDSRRVADRRRSA